MRPCQRADVSCMLTRKRRREDILQLALACVTFMLFSSGEALSNHSFGCLQIDSAEACVRDALAKAAGERGPDISFFAGKEDTAKLHARYESIASPPRFSRLTYTEAVDVLGRSGASFTHPVAWGAGLASEHERWLAEVYVRGPVVVTDYPAQLKPFYMRRNDADGGKTVAAFDLLVPGIVSKTPRFRFACGCVPPDVADTAA